MAVSKQPRSFPKCTVRPWWLVALLAACLLLSACDEVLVAEPPSVTPAAGNTNTGSVTVFFTNPNAKNASSFRGGLDDEIVPALDKARLSIDVAIHELNLWSIRDALIGAHKRGVQVRVVAESDNLDYEEFGDLEKAGIPVLGDRSEGLMHNKFIVIDGREVWTGSTNFTTTDMYFHNNNLLHIVSTPLAENYTTEFEEMFTDDHFGEDIGAATPNPQLDIAGIPVENYFSPDDGVSKRLVELLNDAQKSIHFLAFSFTSDPLSKAMIARARAGVEVSGVMEEAQVKSNAGSDYDRFQQAGLDVRLDGNSHNMHDKIIIIDEKIVITGSYNFTSSAEKQNDENVLIFFDSQLAKEYLQEFEAIFSAAK
jgi:phosphatidylserine/phosphatidylglycerophosphate/cardiolipin synthase-like enzyme